MRSVLFTAIVLAISLDSGCRGVPMPNGGVEDVGFNEIIGVVMFWVVLAAIGGYVYLFRSDAQRPDSRSPEEKAEAAWRMLCKCRRRDGKEATEADKLRIWNEHGLEQKGAKVDCDKAIVDWTEVIRLDPNNASAYWARGTCYSGKGDFDKVISDFTEAIRLDPKNGVAYRGRGFACGKRGDFDKAIADFTQAIRLAPNHAWVYYERGVVYRRTADYPKAEADFAEAMRLGVLLKRKAKNQPNATTHAKQRNATESKDAACALAAAGVNREAADYIASAPVNDPAAMEILLTCLGAAWAPASRFVGPVAHYIVHGDPNDPILLALHEKYFGTPDLLCPF